MGAVPLARVVRSGLEESVHTGHVAVCDTNGRLIARAGDPSQLVFARSCMKPLQASVSLASMNDLALPDREVAVMSASHNGEPVHLGAVRALLERAGLGPESLQTPPDYPLDRDEMARAQHPNRLFHNCSGKHAGMLLACVTAGWNPETYRRRSNPLQRRVRSAVVAATGVEDLATGIDGCGVPVHGMPLRAMATLFARFARPERLGALAAPAGRVTGAMLAEPYLVGGRHRLDTEVMRITGDVVVKEGAEALVCASIQPQGVGIALKVEDGGYRADAPALIEVLRQVDALSGPQLRDLATFARPLVTGGGERVGEVEPLVTLRRR
jgi:L-asparaginase II